MCSLWNNPSFWFKSGLQRYQAREEIIKSFLNSIDEEMKHQKIHNKTLGRMCGVSNLSQIMQRECDITIEVMSDIAFCLGLKLELKLSKKETR